MITLMAVLGSGCTSAGSLAESVCDEALAADDRDTLTGIRTQRPREIAADQADISTSDLRDAVEERCGDELDAKLEALPRPLEASDIDLNFQITEQRYFAIWWAGWVVQPKVKGSPHLEPGSDWIVSYATTAPSAPLFSGETYSFNVHVDEMGEVTYSGDGLRVDSHGINAHPDRLVVEITNIASTN